MEQFSPINDILFSYDGDISFENGDLMLTTGNDLLERKVFKLLLTSINDWKFDKNIGASPNIFIGEQNTRDTGKLIESYLDTHIQEHIYPAIINTKVVPLDYDSIKIYITLYIQGTIVAKLPLTLDFINGLIYTQYDEKTDNIISNKTTKFNTNDAINKPNIYKDRFRLQ